MRPLPNNPFRQQVIQYPRDVMDGHYIREGNKRYGKIIRDAMAGKQSGIQGILEESLGAGVTSHLAGGLLGMTAYHGSPHIFNKFDHSKMGTGEGAQAYGWGTYLAENPEVAMDYKKKLSHSGVNGNTTTLDGKSIPNLNTANGLNNLKKMGFESESITPLMHLNGFDGSFEDAIAALKNNGGSSLDDAKWLEANKGRLTHEKAGNFYEVDLPDEYIDNMLNWDLPLSEQSDSIKQMLGRDDKWTTGRSLYHLKQGSIDDQFNNKSGEIWDFVQKNPNLKDASFGEITSKYLGSKGIKGIKFFDGQSRASGEGTRNFVVFDENDMKILSRNGGLLD